MSANRLFLSKLVNKFRSMFLRTIQWPRIAFFRLLSSSKVIGRPKLHQPLHAVGAGIIKFESNVDIGVYPSPYFFSTSAYIEARNSNSNISIGSDTWINNNFCAIAEHKSITIGKRVLIGANVEIYDSDFHGLLVVDRKKSLENWASSVVIDDDVFIGSNVKILKGVHIGAGSVIGHGSVVTSDIPSQVVACGVPAKVLKVLQE